MTEALCVRPIPGYKGYFADMQGNIWSQRTNGGKIGGKLKKLVGGVRRGYRQINISGHGCVSVHKLVLEAFGYQKEEGMQCRHLSGDKLDNRLKNLEWGTSQENHDDRRRHGMIPVGSNHGNAVLDESQVKKIKAMLRTGNWTQKQLAEMFSTTQTNISSIKRGATWTHIDD